jgi:hypothetical protein
MRKPVGKIPTGHLCGYNQCMIVNSQADKPEVSIFFLRSSLSNKKILFLSVARFY